MRLKWPMFFVLSILTFLLAVPVIADDDDDDDDDDFSVFREIWSLKSRVLDLEEANDAQQDQLEFLTDWADARCGLFVDVALDGDPFGTVRAKNTTPESASLPVSGDLTDIGGLACDPIAPASGPGQIALIERGACSFTNKIQNAADAGYDGVIVYNSFAGGGTIRMVITGSPAVPAVFISREDYETLDFFAGFGTLSVSWGASPYCG